ncbi:hypothetical protein [Bacillus paralicheniformis]|uniref:hypothetical protein n=1 Tax=Bacillus paralicheniformis TaxID=1648923 RepID=UPI001F10C119|nr:hypothetical protein [Bacillus paralicheniformis]
MRIFEILLTVLSFVMLFQQKMPRKLAVAAGFASIGVLAGQIFFEGYRWQMVLIYLISAALAFIAIFGKRLQIKMWKPLKYGLYVLTFAILAISVFLSVYLPVFDLPKPDGVYSVGTKTFHLTDRDREETLTKNPHDKRELIVQVWYPAQGLHGQNGHLSFPKTQAHFTNISRSSQMDSVFPRLLWTIGATSKQTHTKTLRSHQLKPDIQSS